MMHKQLFSVVFFCTTAIDILAMSTAACDTQQPLAKKQHLNARLVSCNSYHILSLQTLPLELLRLIMAQLKDANVTITNKAFCAFRKTCKQFRILSNDPSFAITLPDIFVMNLAACKNLPYIVAASHVPNAEYAQKLQRAWLAKASKENVELTHFLILPDASAIIGGRCFKREKASDGIENEQKGNLIFLHLVGSGQDKNFGTQGYAFSFFHGPGTERNIEDLKLIYDEHHKQNAIEICFKDSFLEPEDPNTINIYESLFGEELTAPGYLHFSLNGKWLGTYTEPCFAPPKDL